MLVLVVLGQSLESKINAEEADRITCSPMRHATAIFKQDRLNVILQHLKEDKLTSSISNLGLLVKSSCHRNAENHKNPINIWNIYLVAVP